MPKNRKKLIVIAGPTASGKTALAIALAKHFNTEIISADSRQIYKELNIGVARPSLSELNTVPHHLIGHVSIHEYYNPGHFEKDALAKINTIFENHDTAFLVGGTGLYIKALCQGLDEIPQIDLSFRAEMIQKVEQDGHQYLLEILAEKDPETYHKIDKSNKQRVTRAAEVLLFTGKPISFYQTGQKKIRPFDIVKIGLNITMPNLEKNIATRVDNMFDLGLLEEAKILLPSKNLNALQTVGYREIFEHLDGDISLEKAKTLICLNTRKYAKRQLTWFNKDEEIIWRNPTEYEAILQLINKA